MRCERARVVSSGLQITLSSPPLPLKRVVAFSSAVPCGWMNTGTPSCSALAQKGWNLGSEISWPSTLPPMAAPRRLYFFTPSSSWAAARVVLLHPLPELGRREVGMLQGHGGEGHEALRVGRADLGELLVLHLADAGRALALRLVPCGGDRV